MWKSPEGSHPKLAPHVCDGYRHGRGCSEVKGCLLSGVEKSPPAFSAHSGEIAMWRRCSFFRRGARWESPFEGRLVCEEVVEQTTEKWTCQTSPRGRGRGHQFGMGAVARTPSRAHRPCDLGEIRTARLRSPKYQQAADGLVGERAASEASSHRPRAPLRLKSLPEINLFQKRIIDADSLLIYPGVRQRVCGPGPAHLRLWRPTFSGNSAPPFTFLSSTAASHPRVIVT